MIKQSERIALVGMACRLPGADSINDFWQALSQGEIHTKYQRCWHDGYEDSSGFIDDPDYFDAPFFNISPMEAKCMSPQLRQLMMVSYQAIESSGASIDALKSLNTGVYCTSLPGDYKNLLANDTQAGTHAYSFSGNAPSAMSGRLSYYYDFHGPSLTIDTACSSGLSVLHVASMSIKNGDCEAALVGGASLFSTSEFHQLATASQMLSDSSQCNTFDEAANGFVASEGIAVLLVMSETKAKQLGLPIFGLIENIALNHNGLSNGIMAPNAAAQASVMKRCHQSVQIDFEKLALIETHGTATQLGDAIEAKGLTDAFGHHRSSGHCYLGATKMMVGHSLVASALISVIKVVMSYHHQTIPGNPLFENLSPKISLPDMFQVNKQSVDWPKDKPHAAISAYGFTGSNGHLILSFEESDIEISQSHSLSDYYVLQAQTDSSLMSFATKLCQWLENNKSVDLNAISLWLMRRPKLMKSRAVIYAKTLESLIANLTNQYVFNAGINSHIIGEDVVQNSKMTLWLTNQDVDFDVSNHALPRLCLPPYEFDSTYFNVLSAEPTKISETGWADVSEALDTCKMALSELLGYKPKDVNTSASLVELGIDSLTALTLISRLEEAGFQANLSMVWCSDSLQEFAESITETRANDPEHVSPKPLISHLNRLPGLVVKETKGLNWLQGTDKPKSVILLPPLNSDYKAWLRQIPLLSTKYQVHIPFYPGFGGDNLEPDFSLESLASLIEQYAVALPSKPHFVGWSLGGVLSLIIAAKNLDVMSSMTLIACASEFDESLFEKTLEMQSDLEKNETLLKIALQTELPINEFISANKSMKCLSVYYQHLMNFKLEKEVLASMKVPALLIFGETDPVVGWQQINQLKNINHTKCVVMHGAGHFIPISRAHEFNELVINFIEMDVVKEASEYV